MFGIPITGSVSVGTTAVALLPTIPAGVLSAIVQVFPASTNLGIVYLGPSTVTTGTGTSATNGVPITATSTPVPVFTANPNSLWVKADTPAQTVYYMITYQG